MGEMQLAFTVVTPLAVLASAIIAAVIFGANERTGDVTFSTRDGEPLAIDEVSCEYEGRHKTHHVAEVEYVGQWDEVDQHWGETQWMMATG